MSQTPSCRTCGASLAPDQRYCLSCGTRVAAPRLDFFAESERAEAEARGGGGSAGIAPDVPAATTTPAPAPSRLDRIGGPMGAAAVVLVALGIGFLIGQGRTDEPPAQRAPVVNIQSGGTATTGELPTADTTVDDAVATDEAPATDEAVATDEAPATDGDVEATATR